MTEIEIRGFIAEQDFEAIKESLLKDFQSVFTKKRLSFVTGDYKLRNLETRLRITNGNFDIAQKVGDIGATSRQEHEMRFELTADQILFLFRTAERLAQQSGDHYSVVMQHENYIFEDDDIEIKIYKQFGIGHFYGFEIESKKGDEGAIGIIAEKYNLSSGDAYDSDIEVRKRNTEINIPSSEISDERLLELINEYLR